MLHTGRYLYVLFCCQQSVEKMLKALYAERVQEVPPRLHNLVRLGEQAGLCFDGGRLDFLRELSIYYIQARYPEEIDDIASSTTPDAARHTLIRTEEMVSWLTSLQTSPPESAE
ncbi:HEPN domain-containing protein [Candidatus Fermentibacteria bacterium]|nr:HEPN domain-containing protein [Candidatus Fermentibacteria bacterium]